MMVSLYGEPISIYTRADAIEDGILVDLMDGPTAKLVREAGFRYPVAMTRTGFDATVWPVDNPEAEAWLKGRGQDPTGRLWDVLYLLRSFITQMPANPSGAYFTLSVIRHDTKPRGRRTMRLKALCGPGDRGEPVITIMLPHED